MSGVQLAASRAAVVRASDAIQICAPAFFATGRRASKILEIALSAPTNKILGPTGHLLSFYKSFYKVQNLLRILAD